MAKLRVGIIGLGFIGTQKHLPGLKSQKDRIELVAFCDLEEARAQKAADEYGDDGHYVTTDWKKVVEDPSLDVIHICTWNTSHCELTVAALEAGKHVMVEKPMAVTGEEARLMRDTAKRVGKKLTVGYQYRFATHNQFIRDVIDDGRVGEIYHAKAHAVRRRGVPIWGCFMDKSKQGGGPLIDLGTHALDLTLWYMGNYEVESVTGQKYHKLYDKPQGNLAGPWDPEKFEVEDSAFGFIKMKNGATIFLEAAWALNVKEGRESCVELVGTEAGVETNQVGSDHQVTVNGPVGNELTRMQPDVAPPFFGAEAGHHSGFVIMGSEECRRWVDAILNDTDPYVLPEQACVVTEILDAIYRSAESGEPVTF
ncbi:Gfo/Idh/MocA family oxidoreductase [Demequina sp. SYSU T00039]|uniref:Gfo/Idh/MocA family oxidoreductase n=1 Tax=Demequina lignilytica TaxID=3051663 RepID=A0AAW7M9A8_9MICO|nr:MULTISPECIES: Gfo/Idh/MocA family oxidoreductase [unclassified Demequina]MDN4477928.1 Gfo/Idh/MocA family oxidoreductase [Demequina sp. SYSU T00039-1]MDN4487837.1 Gfo/Idh/MocA family oxidoreductase [Demequina sp. SYSU T00039]MDN4490780.1 Gfo/Idh/MocA family oxidoreductase [Demequina sp. SYSU T00068]